MYVCVCRGIRDSEVREVGQIGVTEPEDLVEVLGLDDPECCGRCLSNLAPFVALARGELEQAQVRLAFWDPDAYPAHRS